MQKSLLVTLLVFMFLFVSGNLLAATENFTKIFSTNTKGNITFIGNTLTTSSAPAGIQAGTATDNSNSSTGITVALIDLDGDGTTASSTSSNLSLPAGSRVIFAGLFWGAQTSDTANRKFIKLKGPGGSYSTITASKVADTVVNAYRAYQAYADITPNVVTGGNGTYWVADIKALTNSTGGAITSDAWGGWYMIVAYSAPSEPMRNLTVFRGYKYVSSTAPVPITISGFKTYSTGNVLAQIGVYSWDGDNGTNSATYTGDSIKFKNSYLSNGLNPINDFFNSSMTNNGVQFTAKNPNYVNQLGTEADIISTTNVLANGDTSATVRYCTSSERYLPGALTTAIQIDAPDITSLKTADDINGGLLASSDLLDYTIKMTNYGTDSATGLVLRDTIPVNATYVAGSSSIISGYNVGAMTDGTGDDQADYNSVSKVLTFRLGRTASSAAGGVLGIRGTTSIKYRILLNAGLANGTSVSNQGVLAYSSFVTGAALTSYSYVNATVSGSPVVGIFNASPSPLPFGNVASGTNKKDSIYVWNTGNGFLNITNTDTLVNPMYTITPKTGSIGQFDTMKFYVTFTPTASGSQTDSVRFTHNAAGSPKKIGVSGTGTGTFYILTASAGANGSISPSGSISVATGSNKTFTATPNANYLIDSIKLDGAYVGNTSPYTISNITANHTIVATFRPVGYTITVTQGLNGTISPGTTTVNSGGNQSFTITPNVSYHIDSVKVDGAYAGNTSPYVFTNVTANHSITAKFSINTYTITVTQGLNGTISPGTTTVNSGSNQSFTLTSNVGYHIDSVKVDGSYAGNTSPYVFNNITANHSITAKFSINTYVITVTQGLNGTISPGTTTVNSGSNQLFTFTPNNASHIDSIMVDGVNVGNSSSYTFTNVTANHSITAVFNLDPACTLVSPPDLTNVSNDAGECYATISSQALGTPSFTGCIVANVTNDAPAHFPVGTTVITWTVTSNSGKISTCTQSVTVVDMEKPTISINAVSLNNTQGQCYASNVALGTPTTSDNCGVAGVTNNAPANFSVGETTVTWTVTDIHGNTNTTTQTVTVIDNQLPTITSIVPVTVNTDAGECSATTVNLGTPEANDNCGIAHVTNNAPTTFPVGETTVTWTVTDIHGNTATATQTVTVRDKEKPTISINAVTVNNDAGQCSASNVSLGTPTTADNCGVAGVTNNAPTSFSVGETTVIWTVTDIHGNTNTATQTVTVIDNELPTITSIIPVTVNTDAGECSATNVSLGTPEAGDNCGVAHVANNAPASFPVGETTVTWTVTDIHGNTATATQTVTVKDNEKPTISIGALNINNDAGECSASNVVLGTPTTADNCGVASVTNNAPATFLVGETTVTWTVTDIHGNVNTTTQVVTVRDEEKPNISINSVTVNNDHGHNYASNLLLGTPTTSDNCGVAGVTNDAPATFLVGETTVTWTVTDIHGNTNTTTEVITVIDNEPPTINSPVPATVNVDAGQCSATNVTLGTPESSDNCGVASVKNDAQGESFPVGTTTITWTVTDIHGNTTTATQTVTVNDNEKPTISINAVTVNNTAGQCSASNVALGTPTTSDNCGVASVTNDAPATMPVGQTTVTWTVTDIHGNTNTVQQIVTVIDNEVPSIIAPATVTKNNDTGQCSASNVQLGTPSTADNCGIATIKNDAPAQFPVGTTTVTWTVTDVHGNTNTATQNIVILDVEKPTITARSAITLNTNAGQCSVSNVNLGAPTTNDNCGVATVTNNAPAAFPVGVTTVTWTATDIHGNSKTATQTVTVLSRISGKVFYDANGNGLDDDQKVIPNWKITIYGPSGKTKITANASGMYSVNLPAGTYSISEEIPSNGASWMNSTPTSVTVTISNTNCSPIVNFGAYCFSNPCNGRSVGYWHNNNEGGNTLRNCDPSWRTVVNGLYLRNANGSSYTVPTSGSFSSTFSGFSSWLTNSNSNNMAYTLSAQLAANILSSISAGFNSSSVVIIPPTATGSGGQFIIQNLMANNTPGLTINPTTGYGYISLSALQAAAKVTLAANGNTTNSGPARNYHECLKTVFKKVCYGDDDDDEHGMQVISQTPCSLSGGNSSKTRVSELPEVAVPAKFGLEQNYPNPFNPVTTIKYDLPVNSFVMLKVYDILGREVATLINEEQSAGYKSIEFNASTVPSGIYFYKIIAGNFIELKKMILIK